MNIPTATVIVVVLICLTLLIMLGLNSFNIHTLETGRLPYYQDSIEVIRDTLPDVALDIKAEVKYESVTK